jgi:serine protease AprX
MESLKGSVKGIFTIVKLAFVFYGAGFTAKYAKIKPTKNKKNFTANVLLFITLFAVVYSSASAQEKYWVYFKDKDTTGFNPYKFFDKKAIERRQDRGEAINNFSDIPVKTAYIKAVAKLAKSVGYESRWLNAVAVAVSPKQLTAIKQLPFVQEATPMQYFEASPADIRSNDTLDLLDQIVFDKQISMMQGEEFIKRGIDGKGIRIAIFDGGFNGADQNPVFQHLLKNGQIIKTYDFQHKKEFVYSYLTHGAKVLSCLAGMYNNKPMGLATGAEYLLARTEIPPEKHVEEEYWLAAVEWADQNGADIINSSLGYTAKLYPLEAMDGKTSIVAKAAKLAASKGMLVINAMGNDGDNKWEVMGTPADADSVLSVGGVNPFTGHHMYFSSYGPTKDMRMKPNVCAPAVVITAHKNSVDRAYGTSFSAPLVTGFAACVWQLNREKNNMEIFGLIQKSGHLYPYFDYAHGFGIPQASYFFEGANPVQTELPFVVRIENDSIKVVMNDLEVDDTSPFDYLYYHIENAQGILRYYAIIKVNQANVLNLNLNILAPGEKMRFYYKRYMQQITR